MTSPPRPSPIDPDLYALAHRAAQALAVLPAVQAVFLFGSVARGTQNCLSDIDLGVVLDGRGENLPNILDLHHLMARQGLENKVDVVIVPHNNVLLRHEVAHRNVVLYRAGGFDAGAYITRALNDYELHRPLFALQRAARKRALLGDGGSHGA